MASGSLNPPRTIYNLDLSEEERFKASAGTRNWLLNNKFSINRVLGILNDGPSSFVAPTNHSNRYCQTQIPSGTKKALRNCCVSLPVWRTNRQMKRWPQHARRSCDRNDESATPGAGANNNHVVAVFLRHGFFPRHATPRFRAHGQGCRRN